MASSPPPPPPPPPPPRPQTVAMKSAPMCQPPIAEAKTAEELQEIARAVLDQRKIEAKRQRAQLQREKKMNECKAEWVEKVMPNWKRYKGSKLVKKLCAAGIPSSIRGKVWPLLMGNALQITPELMEIFHGHAQTFKLNESKLKMDRAVGAKRKKQGRTEEKATAPKPGDEDKKKNTTESFPSEAESSAPLDDIDSQNIGKSRSLHLIECDLPRTYPSLAFFRDDQPIGRDLRKLLETYAFYRPDVGYIQGMSYIAGVLLLNCDLATAFQCFANLLASHFYFDFFRLEKSKIDVHLDVYQSLFSERLPKLAKHFKTEGVQSDMYMIDWLMTLYSRSMPMNVAARVWDLYLCEGELSLFRVAIGLLRMHESTLLCMEFGDIMQFLHNIPADLDEDELFMIHIPRVEFSKKRFNSIQNRVASAAAAAAAASANEAGVHRS